MKVGFRINAPHPNHIICVLQHLYALHTCIMSTVRHWCDRVGRVAAAPRRGVRSRRGGTEHTGGGVAGRGSCWFFGTVNLTSVCRRDRSPCDERDRLDARRTAAAVMRCSKTLWQRSRPLAAAVVSKDDHRFSAPPQPKHRKQPSSSRD